MKKRFYIIIFLLFTVYVYAEQVDTTNYGIANASPGDYIIRENGDKVILNQADIDYAKSQLRLNVTPANQYTTRTSNEKYSGSGYFFIISIIFIR